MVDLAPDEQYVKAVPPRTRAGGQEPEWAPGLRIIAIAVTVVGIFALIGAGVRLSGGGTAFLWATPFLIWGMVPFGLGLLGVLRRTVGTPRSVVVVLASGFGLAMYGDLIWSSHLSSTAGLAFAFIPLWQSLACGAGLLATLPWRGKGGAA